MKTNPTLINVESTLELIKLIATEDLIEQLSDHKDDKNIRHITIEI